MKLTLTTTYCETIEVSDEKGEQMIADWQDGLEDLVVRMFDDAPRSFDGYRLHQEVE